jgi:hypothetical protein
MQAAKTSGLAEEVHGEQTKGRKTYGKWNPCLSLHDGTAAASNGASCSKGCPILVRHAYQINGCQR